MEFSTKVNITNCPWQLRVQDKILLLGSCFSDNMGDKMDEYYLRIKANPFGTLYNPLSIAHHMDDKELDDTDVIIVTFGTAWVYEKDGKVVDNCKKQPASTFVRRRLTVDEIVKPWREILKKNFNKRFIFTVSPIRHIKDGLHANQISKGILLQATEELCKGTIGIVDYFPSYEIVMDELRDYRYYAEDMLHPSMTAINYLWERFRIRYMYDQNTADQMHKLHQLWMDKNHKILHPESDEAKQFEDKVRKEYYALKKEFFWL